MNLYECKKCGLVIEKLSGSEEKLMCGNETFEKMIANTQDGAYEKHMPTAKYQDGKLEVFVGEVMHPMEENHYISFVQVILPHQTLRCDLTPQNEPKAVFELGNYKGKVTILSYCNCHGLWQLDLEV